MEDQFNNSSRNVFTSGSEVPQENHDSSLNVLSSFLNSSREIRDYSAQFSDLLKHPAYPTENQQQPRQSDGVVPERTSPTSPMTSGQSSTTPSGTKRKTMEATTDDKESSDDKKAMKKQRRLAKNREAAQLFRQRQKEYISNLEARASQLVAANTEANARAELIASENKLMREQLAYLRNFMKQAVSFSFPYGVPGATPAPTSPTSLAAPQNPFLAGQILPSASVGVDAMGNFVDSCNSSLGSGSVGLPSSVPLADGTTISFNLMPSSAPTPPPNFMSFLAPPAHHAKSAFAGVNGGGISRSLSPLIRESVKDEKELSPD